MKNILYITLLIILTVSSVSSFGQKEVKGMVKITGVPTVYGTEPHIYVCIKANTGKIYYVHPDNQKEIRELERYNYFFNVEFIEGPPVSLDSSFHKDGTVRVLSWKKIN